ncbi:WcbI family polysaccharide biosynthesis putative acetyltransferase [Rhizobium rhizogenes]|uniref:Polysaccharide biosynthesis enzyme WcbI domain-containing protein n=1 Tax=Rhizobium rhizogenes (strain K84 / ATCC BAA-868) TaxID=311403 RepID=B9JF47_RHIR8|nr:conserved hypothetical protein [Rhizobium rhizogenes K84]
MEHWLLVSNCQTFGVGNSMELLSPHFKIDAVDIWQFKKNIEKYKDELPNYFRVIIHPQFRDMDFDFSSAQNLSLLPSIKFDAYHPDICYAFSNGLLNGPMGPYHSMIVIGAYSLGLSVDVTRRLFRRDIFEACGFFDRWEDQRSQLLQTFATVGLDISDQFRKWSRNGPFMYSVDHAKAACLHDIANVFMRHHGIETVDGKLIPPDTLVNGACLPVYPEVGEEYGVNGSYFFKLPNEYRLISLGHFIELSFATYSRLPIGSLLVEHPARGRYDKILSVISEAIVAA